MAIEHREDRTYVLSDHDIAVVELIWVSRIRDTVAELMSQFVQLASIVRMVFSSVLVIKVTFT